MIVTSFYTPNGNYPALAAKLRDSCDRYGIRHRIFQLADTGQWLSSTNLKPRVILTALMDAREPVLWMDADCEFLALPLVPEPVDFGIYNWSADHDNINHFPYDPAKLIGSSGVVYFGYTAPAMELLVRWSEAINANPGGVDDQVLSDVYNQCRPPMRCWWMPKSMNFMTGLFGTVPADCTVVHHFVNRGHRQSA